MKGSLCAAIGMAVHDYFSMAHEACLMNHQISVGSMNGHLGYHAAYFKAISYYMIGAEEQKKADDSAQGMGQAVGYLKLSLALMNSAKAKSAAVPTTYRQAFMEKFAEAEQAYAAAKKDNEKVYFEREPDAKDLPPIVKKSFVKFISIEDEITKGSKLEESLRHMVPVEVRVMQDEFRNEVNAIINKVMDNSGNVDNEQAAFLVNYNLPQAVQALTCEDELPKEVWTRIEDFQKRGATSVIDNMFTGIEQLANTNTGLIQKIDKDLADEESEDTMLKNQYGDKWNRLPSNSLNAQFKQTLNSYKEKLSIAVSTDEHSKKQYAEVKESMAILALS